MKTMNEDLVITSTSLLETRDEAIEIDSDNKSVSIF